MNKLKINWWLASASAVVVLLVGLSIYLYSNGPNIHRIEKEKDDINQQYLKTKQDLDEANAQLDEKNKEIEELKKANNNAIRNDIAADAAESDENISQKSTSIYDNINGSDDFKNKITSALNLLSEKDSEHFQMAASQVSSINEFDNYGGKQERRDIYIGADANPAIAASLITHEAQHVYNVYVRGIWSYHTKEQELPCYEAELSTAQRVGAPEFFISSIQNDITYWQSQ